MLAIAGLSARSGVELAARHGRRAVALDVFGDADTRRAAALWLPIGDAATLRLDGAHLAAALRALAQRGDVEGWIAGSGFEEQPELLSLGARELPLVGTAPADIARLRCASTFFDRLDTLGIAHPPVRHDAPSDASGWLQKRFASSGGRDVRRAADAPPAVGAYWQRERSGRALSATFVGNGDDAVLLGVNEQLTQAMDARPYVFAGVVGPLVVDAVLRTQLAAMVRTIARAWRVRGLAGMDFMLGEDGRVDVLEVNARLVASVALYGELDPLNLHWQACVHGRLPHDTQGPPAAVRGVRTVFAPRAIAVGERAAALLAARPRTHDLPAAGTRVSAQAPLCSVSSAGGDARAVRDDLERSSASLIETLEAMA